MCVCGCVCVGVCGCVWVCVGVWVGVGVCGCVWGRERERKRKIGLICQSHYNSNTSDLTILQRVLTFFFLSSLSSEFSKRSLKSTESLSGSVLVLSG